MGPPGSPDPWMGLSWSTPPRVLKKNPEGRFRRNTNRRGLCMSPGRPGRVQPHHRWASPQARRVLRSGPSFRQRRLLPGGCQGGGRGNLPGAPVRLRLPPRSCQGGAWEVARGSILKLSPPLEDARGPCPTEAVLCFSLKIPRWEGVRGAGGKLLGALCD